MVRNTRVNSPRDPHDEQTYMPILPTRKTQSQIQAGTQDTGFYPEVRPHHKGVVLPVEEPTKGQVFSNPNPPQPNHQGQGNIFPNLLTRAGITNFLGSSTTLETPKQPQPVEELEGSKNNNIAREVFATSSRDEKEKGEENQIRGPQAQTSHQRGPFN
jgi:hypothetical protein